MIGGARAAKSADGTSLRKIAKTAGSTAVGSTTVVATIRARTDNSRSFALSGTTLFYSTSSGIQTVSTGGGAVTTLTPDLANSMLVSGTKLFYETPGSELKSVPTAGGTATSLNFFSARGKMVSDGTFLYLATGFGVVKMTIGTPTTWVRFSVNDIWGIALDATNVYWAKFVESTNSTEIYKAPK